MYLSKKFIIRTLAIVLSISVIMQLILYAMSKISGIMFWTQVIIVAVVAYWGIPYLNKFKF
jgi:hypothetical protein